ncbi:MAG: GGDEF domain-containing protein [Microthrixaceae bacterium]
MTDNQADGGVPRRPRPIPGADPLRVGAAVLAAPLLAEIVISLAGLQDTVALLVRVLGWVGAVFATMTWVLKPITGAVAAARVRAADAHAQTLVARTEVDFRTRFERALAQTKSEPTAIRAAMRAVDELMPDAQVTLLLAVPEEPLVGWSVRMLDGEITPASPIVDTPGCAALATGSTVMTTSSSLDACEHIEDPDMAVSALCVPMRLDDRLLGVVSVVGAPGESPDDHTALLIEWLVERTGVRVSEQRRLQGRSELLREDEVTGLPGAQTLQRQLRETIRSLVPFCLALVSIDEFDSGVDGGGDDSLRTLADTLRRTLRPDDLLCRLDGGRFGVLLTNCAASQASLALERVRESLALALSVEAAAPFTFSAGVVESHRATSIDGLLDRAADAAGDAHRSGGNRVMVSAD